MRRFAVIASTLVAAAFSTNARAGTAQRETHGTREFRVYTPDGDAAGKPLVVILHGCTQTADDVADASRMDVLADEKGFVVAYPEQSASSGLNRCWEWWETGNQKREAGEPKEIADGVAAIVDARRLDGERVYVAGISAGGAMSVVLGATYPDRFAAIGVIAGIEYGAATSLSEVLGVSSGGGPDPVQQGKRAHDAMGSFARVVPTLVFHGDADSVVASVNGDQVAKQWLATNTLVLGDGAIAEPTTTEGEAGYPFVRTVHASRARGGSVVEHYLVKGLGHAWPGGKAGGSFADSKGPDASRALWAFFETRTISEAIPGGASEPIPAGPNAGPPSDGDGSPSASSPSSSGDASGCSAAPHGGSQGSAWLLTVVAAFLRRRRAPCR